jgi:hypothetical protein
MVLLKGQFPRGCNGYSRNSHLFHPSAILFRSPLGPARLPNSSRPQRTCPTHRNRQPLRHRVIQYHEMGRGKQEQSGRPALGIRISTSEIRPRDSGNVNKHEGSKPQCPKRTSRRAAAFRSFGLCASNLSRISSFGFWISTLAGSCRDRPGLPSAGVMGPFRRCTTAARPRRTPLCRFVGSCADSGCGRRRERRTGNRASSTSRTRRIASTLPSPSPGSTRESRSPARPRPASLAIFDARGSAPTPANRLRF